MAYHNNAKPFFAIFEGRVQPYLNADIRHDFNGISDNESTDNYISWDVLSKIIDRLPDGYGKIFRLAVLDGLSHKEIGEMLSIAPHSSSSQLHHAKTMLRKLITEYRIGIGIIGMVVMIVTILLQFRFGNDTQPTGGTTTLAIKGKENSRIQTAPAPEILRNLPEDTIRRISAIQQSIKNGESETESNIAEAQLPKDSAETATPKYNVVQDSVANLRNQVISSSELLADNHIYKKPNQDSWSISLSYTGDMGQNGSNRYKVPGDNPDIPPDVPDMIDINEKSRHYMPVVIGISLNKSLSSKWSIETGIQYSFLRSDFLRESKIESSETIQRIHYIGIPLKFNYRIFGNSRFSIYGHGGAALDIPVHATHSVTKFTPGWQKPLRETLNVKAPLQWSAEGGLGLQYHFTPSFSIYAEPSLRYYFNHGTGIRTIRQDKPLEFTIPIGIRLTW